MVANCCSIFTVLVGFKNRKPIPRIKMIEAAIEKTCVLV
jgi:hypothetical protein